jgi:hypothetical protein
VHLLKDLQKLQDNFWKYAWKEQTPIVTTAVSTNTCASINEATLSQIHECVASHK